MVVSAIDETVDGSTLTVRIGDVDRVVHVDALADHAAAHRWQSSCRRIDRLEMTLRRDGVTFVLHGTGHRLPIRRRISAATALGLAATGCPVFVTNERP